MSQGQTSPNGDVHNHGHTLKRTTPNKATSNHLSRNNDTNPLDSRHHESLGNPQTRQTNSQHHGRNPGSVPREPQQRPQSGPNAPKPFPREPCRRPTVSLQTARPSSHRRAPWTSPDPTHQPPPGLPRPFPGSPGSDPVKPRRPRSDNPQIQSERQARQRHDHEKRPTGIARKPRKRAPDSSSRPSRLHAASPKRTAIDPGGSVAPQFRDEDTRTTLPNEPERNQLDPATNPSHRSRSAAAEPQIPNRSSRALRRWTNSRRAAPRAQPEIPRVRSGGEDWIDLSPEPRLDRPQPHKEETPCSAAYQGQPQPQATGGRSSESRGEKGQGRASNAQQRSGAMDQTSNRTMRKWVFRFESF